MSASEQAKTTTAYIALGSNMGDRRENLDRALQVLQDHPRISVTQVSGFHETEPVGGPPGQGRYLNAAAELQTDLSPPQLLAVLLDIERQLGRVRTERYGPRTIDLDLLVCGNFACHDRDLIVPHPRLHQRRFVLEPLAEIAPDLIHPILGRSIRDMLEDLLAETENPAVANSTVAFRSSATRELAGLRAVVTGSTSGIGHAIALALAEGGADVIIHGRRREMAERIRQEVARCGVRSSVLIAELRNSEDLSRLTESAWATWNGLDIWVNNAGADILTGESGKWPFDEKLEAVWRVDVQATILLSRRIGELMKGQKKGVILNMGWDQAEHGMAGESGQLFSTSKGAIMAFTRSLAVTLAPEVRVNCLAPGWIRTAWGERASSAWQKRVAQETPLGRWGSPADVASAARWLVSPAASFITGQIIRINGGAVRG